MLILPIVNKKRVMNIEIKLKNAEKIKRGVCYDSTNESEIIVNKEKFSDSLYRDSKEENAPTEFIRSKSILHPRDFLVTTKSENDSKLYDIYRVAQPPKKVNDSLDRLYGKAITDLRKEIPHSKGRGRYISFEKLGIGSTLNDEKIAKLQRIVKEERDTSRWPSRFKEAGIADLSDTIDFINNFECVLLSDDIIPESSLQDTLKALEVINSRDYRNLKNYYKIAQNNKDIYTKLSYISKIIYDKPLTLIRANSQKQKLLVKKKDEYDYKKSA